jgi:hypothetical protein
MFQDAVAEFIEGIREGFQLFAALIVAPFLVCKEFITSTGRWAPPQDDARADSGTDQTGA